MSEADAFADAYLDAEEHTDTETICRYLLHRFVGGVIGFDTVDVDDRSAFESLDELDIGFEAAVDIDTLGTGFETVLAKRGTQGETGSYYTPAFVVDYIVEETIHPKVVDVLPGDAEELDEAIDNVEPREAAAAVQAIDDVRAVDPACGAGDFLLGLLEELADIRRRVWAQADRDPGAYAALKRTAANNVYGVDLQEEAIEMTKLRIRLTVLREMPRPDMDALQEVSHGD